jgi:hypothetical protein
MPARRTQGLSPDLFTTAAATKAPPEAEVVAPKLEATPAAEPASQRHLLPKDLPGALKHLNDSELDALHEATLDELKRRDRLPSRLMRQTSPTHVTPNPRQPPSDDGAGSLTRGQLNLVRAAFKAGVKPSAIARQFGISQSDVRKALATEGRDRKSGR